MRKIIDEKTIVLDTDGDELILQVLSKSVKSSDKNAPESRIPEKFLIACHDFGFEFEIEFKEIFDFVVDNKLKCVCSK